MLLLDWIGDSGGESAITTSPPLTQTRELAIFEPEIEMFFGDLFRTQWQDDYFTGERGARQDRVGTLEADPWTLHGHGTDGPFADYFFFFDRIPVPHEIDSPGIDKDPLVDLGTVGGQTLTR